MHIVESFTRTTRIDDISSNELFSWHVREGAFERLDPPWQQFTVIDRKGSIETSGIVKIKMNVGPFHTKWVVKHSDYVEGKQFRDTQISGLFSSWTHTHLFEPFGSSSCVLKDDIEYSLPGGPLSSMVASKLVNRKLDQMFDYRHRLTREDLRTHAAVNKIRGTDRSMTVAITGSSGFIGSSLIPFLTTGGHRVIRLVRRLPSYDDQSSIQSVRSIQWDPSSSAYTNLSSLPYNGNIDAVVNLAGENVLGRWTKEKKKRIFESRVNTTKSLCKTLLSLDKPPKVLVSASATGYYGDRGDGMLTEDSDAPHPLSPTPPPTTTSTATTSPSIDFLSDVCRNWEESTQIAKESGIRVVNIRIGTVLSSSGGILAKILPHYRMGLGGRMGNGNQYMSWIALDDLLGIVLHAIADESITGPINAVSPNPITNDEFTMILGKVLSRPTIFSLPEFIIKAALGEELANAAILCSTRVVPTYLLKLNYQFRYPYLELALRHTLGKSFSEQSDKVK
jgi:NAD dependent epimerase/dehydratase family enzyme/ligand-binding SRPBCC domain-containing protein